MSDIRTLYSHSEDDFTYASEDPSEAARYALDNMSRHEFEKCKEVTLYKGVADVKPSIERYVNPHKIIEDIREYAWCWVDDFIGDYLKNLPLEVVDDLREHIVKWADKHNLHPNFFNVKDVEPYNYVLQDGDKE